MTLRVRQQQMGETRWDVHTASTGQMVSSDRRNRKTTGVTSCPAAPCAPIASSSPATLEDAAIASILI